MNDRSADLQCELDDTRERLAEVLETLLRLDAMVEAANDATYTLSHRLEIETWNPGATRLYGYAAHEIVGRSERELCIDSEMERLTNLVDRVRTDMTPVSCDAARRHKDGSVVHVILSLSPLKSQTGDLTGYVVVAHDITERKAAESTHMRLLGELNHRVKNSLATIQSIANLTLRRYDTPAAFVPAFSGRVQALSRAHDVLTANTWKGADLATLVHQQLSLEGMRDGRVAFKGPPATLDPQPALALALVLHELGTNARTHGALAVPDGLVRLSWVTDETISPTGLQLLWQEVDGPPVEPPTRRGFGSQFIEHSLRALGGAAEIAFEPSGVKCAIKVPLTSAEPRKVGAI